METPEITRHMKDFRKLLPPTSCCLEFIVPFDSVVSSGISGDSGISNLAFDTFSCNLCLLKKDAQCLCHYSNSIDGASMA